MPSQLHDLSDTSLQIAAQALEDAVATANDTSVSAGMRLYNYAVAKHRRESQRREIAEQQLRASRQAEVKEVLSRTRKPTVSPRYSQPRSASPTPDAYSFRPNTAESKRSFRMLQRVGANVQETEQRLGDPVGPVRAASPLSAHLTPCYPLLLLLLHLTDCCILAGRAQ